MAREASHTLVERLQRHCQLFPSHSLFSELHAGAVGTEDLAAWLSDDTRHDIDSATIMRAHMVLETQVAMDECSTPLRRQLDLDPSALGALHALLCHAHDSPDDDPNLRDADLGPAMLDMSGPDSLNYQTLSRHFILFDRIMLLTRGGQLPCHGLTALASSASSVEHFDALVINALEEGITSRKRRSSMHCDDSYGKVLLPSKGITNIGNSCYFSTGLQLLCATFGQKDIAALQRIAAILPEGDSTVRPLLRLLSHLRGGEESAWHTNAHVRDVHLLSQQIQSLSCENAARYASGKQADVDVAFGSLVACLARDVYRYNKRRSGEECSTSSWAFDMVLRTSELHVASAAKEQWDAFLLEHPDEVVWRRAGQKVSFTYCDRCSFVFPGYSTYTSFVILELPADLPELRTLQQMVHATAVGTTQLGCSHLVCPICNSSGEDHRPQQRWRRATRILRWPECGIVFVVAQRQYFSHHGQVEKHRDGVGVDEMIDFRALVYLNDLMDRSETMSTTGIPVAAACHAGSAKFGHYYALLRSQQHTGEYLVANDSHVSWSQQSFNTSARGGTLFAISLK